MLFEMYFEYIERIKNVSDTDLIKEMRQNIANLDDADGSIKYDICAKELRNRRYV